MNHKLPPYIIDIISQLEQAGFEAFAVGGAVRDLLLNREPKDWDVATNATPDEIRKIFPDSLYENKFGTVVVKTKELKNLRTKELKQPGIDLVEVTTYRVDGDYLDQRHPDSVKFTNNLKEDLARRDFTVNALAIDKKGVIFDPFNGQQDLKKEVIKAVGDADKRFQEDALRLMRAVRFATEVGFDIEEATREAIKSNAKLLGKISEERIRDEFFKIIETKEAARGVSYLAELGLLRIFLSELTASIDVAQNKHHKYDVFEHLVRSLDYAARQDYSLAVRLASLFHDIGKPQSKKGEGEAATFYNHEYIGAKLANKIMKRLKFPNDLAAKIYLLVKYHQFYYQAEEVTASSVRRLVKNVGKENTKELIQVREADRIGSGVPKAVPYKLRHLKYMIEQVATDPVSVKMLAIDGHDIMKKLDLKPSPKLGLILNSLLAEVLEDPKLNSKDLLLAKARQLSKKPEPELKKNLAKIEAAQKAQAEEIKKKYYVK